jgi:5-methylcytosine-specific restriction endonuclease McrA
VNTVLVLNKNWQPVATVAWTRAMSMLVSGQAKALDRSCQVFDFEGWSTAPINKDGLRAVNTAHTTLYVPSVLVLQSYSNTYRTHMRYSRNNLFLRDDYTCAYCNQKFTKDLLNVDHVIPRAQGGLSTWDNLISSCRFHNTLKADRTPEQAGMTLHFKPYKPTWSQLFHPKGTQHPDWEPWTKNV